MSKQNMPLIKAFPLKKTLDIQVSCSLHLLVLISKIPSPPYARTSFVDDPLILWFIAAKTFSKKMMVLWTFSKKVKNKIDISL